MTSHITSAPSNTSAINPTRPAAKKELWQSWSTPLFHVQHLSLFTNPFRILSPCTPCARPAELAAIAALRRGGGAAQHGQLGGLGEGHGGLEVGVGNDGLGLGLETPFYGVVDIFPYIKGMDGGRRIV